ncbi:MAG: hypothetical protein PHH84_01805 [Oscillospiraceae bacterium]|nr:hypothetical protein [Oscillospiraceae bacterium]MDD4414822.1 hypothetical protein [Oscillospiraceae bacterium]
MNKNEKVNKARIEIRISPGKKKKIKQIADKCNLSVSEYMVQRALGYLPKTVLPDAFYLFNAKLCELCNAINGKVSADVEEQLLQLIDDIRSELILSGKEPISQIKSGLEGDKKWRPQGSGRSKES